VSSRRSTACRFTVKENIDVAGTPTTQGAKALINAYPARDAPWWSGCEPRAASRSAGPTCRPTRSAGSPAGSPVRLARSADQSAFERQFLATLNGGQPVPIPAVPASRQLAVSYDGHGYAYRSPRTAGPGPVQIRLANTSATPFDGFTLLIGKLAAGRTLSDVQAVIRVGTVLNAPPWFQATAILPAASGANPAWGLTLTPGRYALVCMRDRSSALYALTELTVG